MNRFIEQLRTFHDSLDASRRRVLYIAVAIAVATVAAVGIWAAQPTTTVVARASSRDELEDAEVALARVGVAYTVDDTALTVTVAGADVATARAALAEEPGDPIEESEFGQTPEQEKFKRQLTLQRSLQRTINTYEGVASSRVHLNLPAQTPFFHQERRATASVLVRPDSGTSVSPRVARTIASLVSHAVADMSEYDVRVSDKAGRELWPGSEGGGLAGASEDEARREAELSQGLLTSLAAILGSAEDLTVAVSVEMETAVRQSTVQQLDPASGVTTEEVIKSEQSGTRAPEGVPGTETNLPERTTSSSGANSRSSDQTTTKFDYSKTVTTTNVPAGGVRRLSASVLINSTAVTRVLGVAADAVADPEAEAALKADLEEAARAALGFDEKRGDQVVVKFVRFADAVTDVVPEPTLLGEATPYLPAGVAVLAVLAVLFGVVRPLLKMVRGPVPLVPGTTMVNADGVTVTIGEDGLPANSPMPEEETETSVDLMDRLRQYIENYQAVTPGDLSDLVHRETVHSAEVVRRWIRG